MNYTINSADNYTLTLVQTKETASILQNIALLLNTKRGTMPMYRDFGLPMEFVDKPIDVAETLAYLEISDAIEKFEPRATLKDVTLNKNSSGQMHITVEVSIDEQQ